MFNLRMLTEAIMLIKMHRSFSLLTEHFGDYQIIKDYIFNIIIYQNILIKHFNKFLLLIIYIFNLLIIYVLHYLLGISNT